MKSMALARVIAAGLLAALILSLLSIFCLNKILDYGASNHRRYFLLSVAAALEGRPLDKKILENLPGPRPHLPPFMGKSPLGPPPPPPGGPGRPPSSRFWVVSKELHAIASTTNEELPEDLKKMPLPTEPQEVTSTESFFRISPPTFVVRLNTAPTAYLVAEDRPRNLLSAPLFIAQTFLTFTTVSLAIFFSLFFTFLYLRRKSQDAKKVLLQLERGDLKARFEIKRMDEFGNLMLDFNRMAEEIERLVYRIHDTEKSRKNLLQELGHDLRTPLTGLTTAYETLRDHFTKITENDRTELFGIMGGEIVYLKDLLEKLLTIATLDEPHYKKTTESIDLEELLSQELKSRQNAATSKETLKWTLNSAGVRSEKLLGDSHLLLRLFRNGLDNAAKYAQHTIEVTTKEEEDHYEVLIEDDGPGLNEESLVAFGKRKEYRARAVTGLQYSLGLGSVIMKSVAELHGGSVEIENKSPGARLRIRLPKT